MKSQRVLCPVDLSENSRQAVDFAAQLVDRTAGGELVLLYVALPELPESSGFAIGPVNAEIEKDRRRLEEILPADCGGLEVRHVVRRGEPSDVICRYAADGDCDLIVMTTHGRTGLSRLLMGSVAEHVMRHAPCPVLNVRSSVIGHAVAG